MPVLAEYKEVMHNGDGHQETDYSSLGRWIYGLLGAVAGGAVGIFVVDWLAGQGYYFGILPGVLTGLSCATCSRIQSDGLGLVCSLLAFPFGIVAAWCAAPFAVDDSLYFYIRNLNALPVMEWVMQGLGVAFAWWFGRGRTSVRSYSK